MEKINFVNNQPPYISGENLNQLQSNVENAINGVVLYENADGSNQTITLSDSAENYNYIEIYFEDTNKHTGYTKVYNPNGKVASLICCYSKGSQNVLFVYTKNVTISGNSITPLMYGYFMLENDGLSKVIFEDVINITKVVGYK